jgi:hypothetical protein
MDGRTVAKRRRRRRRRQFQVVWNSLQVFCTLKSVSDKI